MKNTKNLKVLLNIALAAVIGLTTSCASGPKADKPPAPQNFTAKEIMPPRGITAKWDAVEGATRYRVTLNRGNTKVADLNTNNTTLTINSSNLPQNQSLLPSTIYTVRVSALIGSVVGASSPEIRIMTGLETAAEKAARERQTAEEAQKRAAEEAKVAHITNSPAFQSLIGTWSKDVGSNIIKTNDTVTFPKNASEDVVVSRNNIRFKVLSISENQITMGDSSNSLTLQFSISGNTLTVSNATTTMSLFRSMVTQLNGTYTKR